MMVQTKIKDFSISQKDFFNVKANASKSWFINSFLYKQCCTVAFEHSAPRHPLAEGRRIFTPTIFFYGIRPKAFSSRLRL